MRMDVREDLRNGRSPLLDIIKVVARLSPEEELWLVAPFKPVPLLSLMAREGFGHSARQMESGDWEVVFSRSLPRNPDPNGVPSKPDGSARQSLEVDARGLEPPEPLVRILEAV